MKTKTKTDFAEYMRRHNIQTTIDRFARVHPDGRRMLCRAGKQERWFDGTLGSEGKVIYDSVETAQECADELLSKFGIRQYVYPCPRSRHGHCHLTSKKGID